MRFEAQPAVISIGPQGRNLAFPVDVPRTDRPPYWLVSFHVAVLDMDVYNAPLRNKVVPVREWIFARYQRICRIPYELQVRVIHGFENGHRLGGGSKIAGMLVLETDNETLFRGLIREIRLGARDLRRSTSQAAPSANTRTHG